MNKISIRFPNGLLWIVILIVMSSSLYAQYTPEQNENLSVTGLTITPAPATVGGTVRYGLNFGADQGTTMHPSGDEEIVINVCPNLITQVSWKNATITSDPSYADYIQWLYEPGSNCWQGKITQNMPQMTGGFTYFDGLIVSGPATIAEANNYGGVGFTVNLVPHAKDPSNDLDDDGYIRTYTVETVDLAVTKTVNNSAPAVGENVVFTITATNNGPSPATGVRVTDALPSGYNFVNASPSAGSWSASTNSWTIGSLAIGASATMQVTANVLSSGNYLNIATVSGNETDTNPDNNSDEASVTPGSASADLSITKVVNLPVTAVGQTVIFTITAGNNGPQAATGVVVNDVLPAGYTFMNASASSGTWLAPNWTIGPLASGGQATLTITAVVNASGSYLNTATITGNETDPDPANNTDSDQVVIQEACTTVLAGTNLSATISGNNSQAGYTTVFVLTNGTGVIQQTSANPQFTAPSTAGEYRIYAVNYGGAAPSLNSGVNINSVEGSVACVDVSDNYKCYTVQSCPPPTVSVQAGSPTAICAGQSTMLVAQGCTGTVTWYANGTQNGQTGSTITVSPASTTSYTAACSNTGCGITAQSTQAVVITVTQSVTPTGVNANVSIPYSQANATLTASCSNGTYIWKNASGTIVSGIANPSFTVGSGSTTYTVACGEGSCFVPVSVTVFKCSNPMDNCLTAKVTRVR